MRAVILAVVVGFVVFAGVARADVAIRKVGVEVAPTDPKGDKWDRGFGSEPDPRIEILVDGEVVHRCPAVKDTFKADCAVAERAFEDGATVSLRVFDEDVLKPDPIGNARGHLLEGQRRQPLTVDGKLVSAYVEVDEVDGPGFFSSMIAKVGARGLGAMLGVALALLLFRLLGERLLTPGDDNPKVRFWRSPILLASAASSIVGMLLANLLRGPNIPLAAACIPYVLGGFAVTAPIIDAYKHEHLGNKRLRLLVAGVATMFAVPIFDFLGDFFTGIAFLGKHLGWTFVGLLLLLCLL